ncbi:MAG TPA: NAD(P)-binding domain-containing protein [Pseudonocardia sp.]|uniref:NADPH-dependent F420 reductase n=1 Tax=Pseudonocardia sp. TaxID=60912 RepID=UPI002B4B2838|nr:NAD(P)-binding domain-containing protein [Pseudonocardia sp.]HLU59169.1 NAD(P)-binding domain-containing protein [Pseudonocardia sp.]
MTRIAVLGTGAVGAALAGALARAGHTVTAGSRDPARRAPGWGVPVPLAGLAEAAEGADVVVNATPGHESVDLLRPLAPQLAGSVLVDVANAVRTGADGFASALCYPGSSLAEQLQRALPGTRVVKTLNTIGPAEAMAAPDTFATPPSAFVSGDDDAARAEVAALLVDLGWRPEWVVDLGGLATARVTEAFVLLVRPLVRALGPVPFGLAVAR